MSMYGRNDVASAAARSGVPINQSRNNVMPVKSSRRIRTSNGVEVDEVRWQSFSDHVKSFASSIAAHPATALAQAGQMAQTMLALHAAEMDDQRKALQLYYDSPRKESWAKERDRMQRETMSDQNVSVAKSQALIRELYGDDKAGMTALLNHAADTGWGDSIHTHRLLNKVADRLAGTKKPAARLYGSADGSPTLAPPKVAPRAPRSAPTKSAGDIASYSGRKASPSDRAPLAAGSVSKRLYGV